MPPGPRAGFSMCVHKRRALLFGGVVDIEVEGFFFSEVNEWDSLHEISHVMLFVYACCKVRFLIALKLCR